jgi:hypothetical protein
MELFQKLNYVGLSYLTDTANVHEHFILQITQNGRENKKNAIKLGKWSERPDELFRLMAKYQTLPDIKVYSNTLNYKYTPIYTPI